MPNQQTINGNINLNFDFTVNEVNLILNALGELPAKTSMGLINKMQVQSQMQIDMINANKKKETELKDKEDNPKKESTEG